MSPEKTHQRSRQRGHSTSAHGDSLTPGQYVVEGCFWAILLVGMFNYGWETETGRVLAPLFCVIPGLYAIWYWLSGRGHHHLFPATNAWFLLAAAVLAGLMIQQIPLGGALSIDLPIEQSSESLASRLTELDLNSSGRLVAVDATASRGATVRLAAWVFLFVGLLHVVRHRSASLRFSYVLALLGLLQGGLGWLSFFEAGAEYRPATGTLFNRSHYGIMTAMLLPYTWWFIQWRLAHRPNAYSSRPRIDQALLIGRFFFFVALGGILASASRSGIFIGLPLVFAYILTERKINPAGQWSDDWDEVQEMEKSRGRSFIRLSPLILKVLTIAGGVVLIIPLLLMARGGASGWLTHERFDYWVTGLAIFADNPIWGIGQGGSRQMLNIYTERVAPSEIIHFHNDYLQFLVEWGLVMSVIIGGLAVSAILKTRHDWKKQKVSSRNVVIALRRAAAWSIAIALAAAFVDFHLRIFYVATIFAGSVTIWIAGGWRYFAKN